MLLEFLRNELLDLYNEDITDVLSGVSLRDLRRVDLRVCSVNVDELCLDDVARLEDLQASIMYLSDLLFFQEQVKLAVSGNMPDEMIDNLWEQLELFVDLKAFYSRMRDQLEAFRCEDIELVYL